MNILNFWQFKVLRLTHTKIKSIENKLCYYYSTVVLKQGSIIERIDLCELDGEMLEFIGLS